MKRILKQSCSTKSVCTLLRIACHAALIASICIGASWCSSAACAQSGKANSKPQNNAKSAAESKKKTNSSTASSKNSNSVAISGSTKPMDKATLLPSIQHRYDSGKVRYVHGAKGVVRSGPADSHYVTQELPTSSRVEVYLESTDGWSGIRPPAGSHNWIPAKNAYLLPGGVTAEIVDEDTVAWVGSDLALANGMQWQTELARSQLVQLLGEDTQVDRDGKKNLWYRIAPPQGEFRWIRTSSLSDSPPTDSPNHEGGGVRLASHSEQAHAPAKSKVLAASGQSIEIDGPADGEMVWSDEAEVLAQVNREIRKEQAASQAGAPAGSIHEEHDAELLIAPEYESAGSEVQSVEQAMTPAELARAKRHKAAQHQVDSLQHWDTVQASTDPSLKVRPLSSVLGLVGLSVVEADRKPVRNQIAQDQFLFQNRGLRYNPSLSNLGPAGASRLDHLPRPGRAPRVSSPFPSSLPSNAPYEEGYGDTTLGVSGRANANAYAGDPSYATSHTQFDSAMQPLDPNKPMLSRLWNSNQPIFGPGAGSSPPPSSDWSRTDRRDYRPDSAPDLTSPRSEEWYGIRSPSSLALAEEAGDAFREEYSDTQFNTPEIQTAMLELSRVVAQPTERWELESLRRQCRQWIDFGGSSLVRGEARLLLDRVDRFESLRTRTLGSISDPTRLAMSGYPVSPSGPTVSASFVASPSGQQPWASSAVTASQSTGNVQTASANLSQAPIGMQSANTANPGIGEASGWLVQVHGAQPGQPEFALTDDQGTVIAYVQTTAALNIRRYLQQPVIVHGQRGYISGLAARQIVAERIVRMR